MTTRAINDANFDSDVLQSGQPVLVDFWAEWCGPCKQIAPTLEAISEELSGVLTIAKMNIDEEPSTAAKYGVRGIPTMMLFRDGRMVDMKLGAQSKGKILEWLNGLGIAASAAA